MRDDTARCGFKAMRDLGNYIYEGGNMRRKLVITLAESQSQRGPDLFNHHHFTADPVLPAAGILREGPAVASTKKETEDLLRILK